jgi:hypothetical protein
MPLADLTALFIFILLGGILHFWNQSAEPQEHLHNSWDGY